MATTWSFGIDQRPATADGDNVRAGHDVGRVCSEVFRADCQAVTCAQLTVGVAISEDVSCGSQRANWKSKNPNRITFVQSL